MYSVMATMKLQRERLKSIEVKPEAVEDFDNVLEVSRLLMSRTVVNNNCANQRLTCRNISRGSV